MSECFAGVDLGGTKIAAALADRTGKIIVEAKVDTNSHEGPLRVLERIGSLIEELSRQTGQRPAAMGMGVPGLVDLATGATRFLPNLPTHWRDIEAGAILSKKLGCPVRLLNDVRAATLGELTFGSGRGVKTMALFALGTGIGGGIVVDGQLRLGPYGAAGELGHLTLLPSGSLCGCGNRGCLETLASGPAIAAVGVRLLRSGQAPKLHELVKGDPGRVTAREMAQAAEAGDDMVREALIHAFEFLGIAVANVIVTIHPELIVLAGGVANVGPILVETVRRVVTQRVCMIPTSDLRIEPSALEDDAGVLGAVALAIKPITGG